MVEVRRDERTKGKCLSCFSQSKQQEWNASTYVNLYPNLINLYLMACIIHVLMMMQFHFRIYATGGMGKGGMSISSAEYSEDGSTFVFLPKMPEGKSFHCMTVLENGDIFVAGGFQSVSVFIYECDKKQWKKCPDMLTNRINAYCGVIKREDGKEEVVVAGGWNSWDSRTILDTVEIYNVEDSKWISGIATKVNKC
jgi:hypothetical protein